jgi:tRNA(Ile)-lysidine synthase
VLKAFITNIEKNELFSKKHRLLVAVSGGVDSMVLCNLLFKTKYKFSIAHCNFLLRDLEANEDELFVEHYAQESNIMFYKQRFETKEYAKQNALSIQMAARELRYTWFMQLLKKHNYDYILTAHHLDDNIETFFINLLRGTGINGLKGITMKKESIVRPLLFASRIQIEEYAASERINFRTDSSNREEKYLRNQLRLSIIPKLKEINPSFNETLQKNISHLNAANDFINQALIKTKKKICKHKGEFIILSIPDLLKESNPNFILYNLLLPYSFTADVSDSVFMSLQSQSGAIFKSPTHELLKDRNTLIIKPNNLIFDQQSYTLRKENKKIKLPIQLDFKVEKGNKIIDLKNTICLDADKIVYPLSLCKWQKGDKFKPLGSAGFKKLSDYFSD